MKLTYKVIVTISIFAISQISFADKPGTHGATQNKTSRAVTASTVKSKKTLKEIGTAMKFKFKQDVSVKNNKYGFYVVDGKIVSDVDYKAKAKVGSKVAHFSFFGDDTPDVLKQGRMVSFTELESAENDSVYRTVKSKNDEKGIDDVIAAVHYFEITKIEKSGGRVHYKAITSPEALQSTLGDVVSLDYPQ